MARTGQSQKRLATIGHRLQVRPHNARWSWRPHTILACVGLCLVAAYRFDSQLYINRQVPIPSLSVFAFCTVATFFLLVELGGRAPGMRAVPRQFVPLFVAIQLSSLALLFGGQQHARLIQFLKTDAHTFLYLLFCACLLQLLRRDSLPSVLRFYYYFLVATAVFGIVQYLTLLHLPTGLPRWALLSSEANYSGFGTRVASVFLEPSWFAPALVDGIVLGCALGLREGFRKYWYSLLALGTAFILSASLSGYFLLAVALAAFSWKALRQLSVGRRRLIALMLWAIMLAPALYLLPIVQVSIIKRTAKLAAAGDDPYANTRLQGMIAVGRVWLHHPLIGVGYGGTSFYAWKYYQGFWAWYVTHPEQSGALAAHAIVDSFYAELLSDTGLVGIAGMLLCAFLLLREEKSGWAPHSVWPAALWALMVADLLSLLTTGALMQPRFWIIASLFLAYRRIEGEKERHTRFSTLTLNRG